MLTKVKNDFTPKHSDDQEREIKVLHIENITIR